MPTTRPVDSSVGATTSSVVPGYVVDSRMMSWPRRRWFLISSTALTM